MTEIAIVEDMKDDADAYRKWLTAHDPQYRTSHFSTRVAAADAFSRKKYDLILLDIQLGEHDRSAGFGLLHKELGQSSSAPVIIISGAQTAELYREISRNLDAWDYLEKPVSASSLISVVGSALRATTGKGGHAGELPSGLELDLANARYPTWNGRRLIIPITAQRILHMLASAPGSAVSKEDLFTVLPYAGSPGALRVHIAAIKAAFKDVDPGFDKIKTVPALGYLWQK